MRIKPTTLVIALLLLLLVASVGFDARGALMGYLGQPTAGATGMPGMHAMAGPVNLSDPNAAARCPMMQGGSEKTAGPGAPGQDACGGGGCGMDEAGPGACPMGKPAAKSDAVAAKAATGDKAPVSADKTATATYVCPMCSDVKSDQPGKCPHCGMDLVKKK